MFFSKLTLIIACNVFSETLVTKCGYELIREFSSSCEGESGRAILDGICTND